MNRRDWMKTAGAGSLFWGASGFLPRSSGALDGPSTNSLDTSVQRLKLRHTWTTTMSSSEYRDTLHVRLSRDGVTGIGEGAPIVRYHETALDGQKAIESLRAFLLSADPWQYTKIMSEVSRRIEGQYAAKAALDIALFDWVAKKL